MRADDTRAEETRAEDTRAEDTGRYFTDIVDTRAYPNTFLNEVVNL